MAELTKEWLLTTIAELEEERDATPGAVNEDAAMALAAMKIALASLEAEPVCVIDQSNLDYLNAGSDADVWPVSRTEMGDVLLYRTAPPAPVSVPAAMEMDDDFDSSFEHGKAVGWNAYRAAMLQGANGKPELTVWYGAMPESNGKANWTAILHRKGEGRCMNGFTIDRSEYPGRVLYAADRVRYLIGEKSERPSILDYDADAHSGYMKTGNSPVIPDGWVACSERMPDDDDFVYIWPRPDFGVELHVGQYCECHPKGDGWYAQVHEQNYGIEWCPITVTHWMPLPAAPQQEVTQALAKGMERYGDAMQKLADSGD